MKEDYIKRINQILTFIDDHLESDLSLEVVAKVGCYSPFHLHRLFKAITNETLNAYVTRKRVERAAMQLVHKHELTIAEVALQNGFNSNSSFTRAFSKLYGQSPTDFRKINFQNFSKIGKMDSKIGEVNRLTDEYFCNINNLKNWMMMNAKIELKELPQLRMAYITQIGVDGLENAFDRIVKWARPKGILAKEGSDVVRVFHDSFKITDEDKIRMSIGVIVNDDILPEGEVGISTIESGKYLVGRFEIVLQDFEKSWNGLFLWMNDQGYKKAEGNPFEIYHNNFNEHPEKKCLVDFCIPVE